MVERKTPVESERRAVECLVHDFLEVMEARGSSRTALFSQLVDLVCEQRAAAIEAAKQSGDACSKENLAAVEAVLGAGCSAEEMQRRVQSARRSIAVNNYGDAPCTPPTENKDERERLLEDAINDLVDCYPQLDSNSIVDSQDDAARQVLLALYNKISDAADKAGFERGHTERDVEYALDVPKDAAAWAQAQVDLALQRKERTTLQSRYQLLTAAANIPRRCIGRFNGRECYVSDAEWHEDIGEAICAALAETLPETEEKKT